MFNARQLRPDTGESIQGSPQQYRARPNISDIKYGKTLKIEIMYLDMTAEGW